MFRKRSYLTLIPVRDFFPALHSEPTFSKLRFTINVSLFKRGMSFGILSSSAHRLSAHAIEHVSPHPPKVNARGCYALA